VEVRIDIGGSGLGFTPNTENVDPDDLLGIKRADAEG
jgi:hypothetical protein